MCDNDDELVIFVIGYEEFVRLKPVTIVLLTCPKIEQIFALDCFNENSVKMLTFNKPKPNVSAFHHTNPNHNHNHSHGGNNHGHNRSMGDQNQNQRYFSKQAKPPRSRVTLTYQDKLLRELNSNLNKISLGNQNVIEKKIEKIVDKNNVSEIANIILQKCSSNGTYMSQLMDILRMLQVTYEKEVQQCIEDYIAKYTTEMPTSINFLTTYNYDDYDEFCKFLKGKNEIMSGFRIVLIYVKTDKYETPSIEVYFEKILGILGDSQHVHLQDMMVQMIALFFEVSGPDVSEFTYSALCEAYTTTFKDMVSNKSKFIFQDVIKKYAKAPPPPVQNTVPSWQSCALKKRALNAKK